MKLYGLQTCDSCRKAIKVLTAAGYSFDYVDVRKDGVPGDVMAAAFARFGAKLVNKSSATWRGFSDAQKASDALELLQANPTLMKRPLIVRDEAMTLGWKDEAKAQYL